MVLPAFGMVSEIIPVFARKPIFGYRAIAAATAGDRVPRRCSSGRTTCSRRRSDRGARLLHDLELRDRRADRHQDLQLAGDAVARAPSSSACRCCSRSGSIAQFVIGGVTGIILAVFPVDWQLTDTYFVVAHMHHVLFGGACSRYWPASTTGSRR